MPNDPGLWGLFPSLVPSCHCCHLPGYFLLRCHCKYVCAGFKYCQCEKLHIIIRDIRWSGKGRYRADTEQGHPRRPDLQSPCGPRGEGIQLRRQRCFLEPCGHHHGRGDHRSKGPLETDGCAGHHAGCSGAEEVLR